MTARRLSLTSSDQASMSSPVCIGCDNPGACIYLRSHVALGLAGGIIQVAFALIRPSQPPAPVRGRLRRGGARERQLGSLQRTLCCLVAMGHL
ncbi:hypothetical protein ABIB83_005281 [Bradyrhizobium sp. I1.8.5]|jgi:hypothetical protein